MGGYWVCWKLEYPFMTEISTPDQDFPWDRFQLTKKNADYSIFERIAKIEH